MSEAELKKYDKKVIQGNGVVIHCLFYKALQRIA